MPGVREIVAQLEKRLSAQFSGFRWAFEPVSSRHHTGEELRNPLHLVTTAFREKVARHWDVGILVTDAVIRGTTRPFTVAVPASALEVGVVSRSLFEGVDEDATKTASVIIYLLGSLWGLAPAKDGAMHLPELPERMDDITPVDFGGNEAEWLKCRLAEIADTRLEETAAGSLRRNLPLFYLRSLRANFRGIARDVLGYRPWWQPFRLARLTAAAVIAMLFVFLGAEAWELGFHLAPGVLVAGALLSVFVSTAVIYSGQNLSEIAPVGTLTEQLARTRIVLFLCVLIGMLSLGVVLFALSFLVATFIPTAQLETWTGQVPDPGALSRFSTFTAMLGVLAGALGGYLEDNDNLKARFFFDEEL